MEITFTGRMIKINKLDMKEIILFDLNETTDLKKRLKNSSPIIAIRAFCPEMSRAIGLVDGLLHNGAFSIDSLNVDMEYQGVGIGQKLLSELEQTVKKLGALKIDVISNQAMVNFYLKNGYKKKENDVCNELFEKVLV
jgi:ribosomal protein S18 acetylase RimI-like enzyme